MGPDSFVAGSQGPAKAVGAVLPAPVPPPTPTFGFAALPLALFSVVVKTSIPRRRSHPLELLFLYPQRPTETAPPSPAFWALLSELGNGLALGK